MSSKVCPCEHKPTFELHGRTLLSYAPACTVFRGSLPFTPGAVGRAPSFWLPLAGYARSAARPEAPGLKAPLSGWGEPRWLLVCARRHVRLGIWPSPETAQGLPLDITYRDIACPEQESQVGVKCVCWCCLINDAPRREQFSGPSVCVLFVVFWCCHFVVFFLLLCCVADIFLFGSATINFLFSFLRRH